MEAVTNLASAASEMALGKWRTARSNVWTETTRIQNNFDFAIQAQSFTVFSPRERAENLAQLLQRTQDEIRLLDQNLRQCRTTLHLVEQFGASRRRGIIDAFRNLVEAKSDITVERIKSLTKEIDDYSQHSDVLPVVGNALCQIDATGVDITLHSVPRQAPLWGVWTLLETQSIPFVTIWGMLGAGLLGSSLSLMRSQSERRLDIIGTAEMFAGNFATAILLYLVVKGGLIVVGTNTTEPNVYFLLSLCLMGTVFSDDIWTWARARIKPIFSGEGSTAVSHNDSASPIAGAAEASAQGKPVAGAGESNS